MPTERHFSMPGPAEDKPWYSFDYGPIHFTIYSTEHRFHPGELHLWGERKTSMRDWRSKLQGCALIVGQ